MKNTRQSYERHLNELYTDVYSMQDAINNFCYPNNGKIRKSTVINAYHNHELGTLLRRHDPIAFNVGFNEWRR